MAGKMVAALLQVIIIVLLARNLPPSQFAVVVSAMVALQALVALNGLGLLKQMSVIRAREPDSPELAELFSLRLTFTYASVIVWLAGALAAAWLTADSLFLTLVPLALWLLFEQTTQIWNSISIVDGKSQVLVVANLIRRVPVVLTLIAALATDSDAALAWSCSLTAGSFATFLLLRRGQEPWARGLRPSFSRLERGQWQIGFWWSQLGQQVRNLDVAAITAISSTVGGAYALPARLISPINMVALAIASTAFPRLVRRKKISRWDLLAGLALGSVVPALAAATLAIGAPLLPVVAGDAYAGSVGPLRILCLASLPMSAAVLMLVYHQARSAAGSRMAGGAFLVTGCLQVAFSAAASAKWGATGAAWAVVVTQCALAGLLIARGLQQGSDEFGSQESH